MANYFSLNQRPNFRLYEYSVGFGLEEDRTYVRRAIVGRVAGVLGGPYLFDGK